MRKIELRHSFVLGLISALVCSLLSVPSHAAPELIREATTLTVCTSLKTSNKILSKTNTCNQRIYETSTWFEEGKAPEGTPNSKIISLLTCQSKANSKSIMIRKRCNPYSQISKKWERPLGPPGAPKIVSVSADKLGTARVLAQESPNNGGARVTQFTLSAINDRSPEKSVRASSSVNASKANVIQVNGLTPGETYNFQLTATNIAGTSQYSSAIEPFVAPTIPNAPSITSALATGPNSATISFTTPTFDGGSPITKYTIRSSNGISKSIDSSLLNGKFNFEGLSPLTSYTFTMTADNVSGESLSSAASLSITTFAPSPLPEPSAPSAPSATRAQSSPLAEPAFTLSRNSITRIVNQPGDGFTILSTGGLIDRFLISSSIPGMNFNATTGELSGIPTQVATIQTYTVTALNNSGAATATFTLRVEDETVANPAFSISSSSETVTAGSAITGYTINSTGGPIANFTLVNPQTLPSGLTFDSNTGLLSGTPITGAEATNYVIEGTNLNGLASATFTLTVLFRASKVAITRASMGSERGVAFTTQPRITIQDSSNNTVLSSSAVVTATISAGGTLVGTTTATASAGVATFTNLGVSGTVGTTYTITYTVAGLAVATSMVKVSRYCDGSFACNVGDTGPGGGIIFYAAPTGFLCGTTLDNLCRYLEAAPLEGTSAWSEIETNWSGNVTGSVTTSVSIGAGYKNTIAILAMGSGGSAPGKAGTSARAYRGPNNRDDWFLPSKDELNELYSNRVVAGGFERAYWSSSEYYNGTVSWIQYPDGPFNAGLQGGATKDSTVSVRPIRAFGDWMSPNSRFKGRAITSFGSTYASYNGALNGQAGSVTLTSAQASDSSTALSNVTNFLSLNLGVDVEVQISRLINASGGTYALPVYYDNDDFEKVGLGDYLMIRVSLNGNFAYYRVNILVEYSVGDIGPSGGRIFYKSLSSFICGTNGDRQCNYLEVAPTSGSTSWPANPVEVWGIPPLIGSSLGTGTAIGTGFRNTTLMIAFDAQQGGTTTSSSILTSYRTLSEFKDWYLPSLNELLALKTFVGTSDSENQAYWSSSESTWQNAWQVRFTDGGSQEAGKSATGNVARAIRSF